MKISLKTKFITITIAVLVISLITTGCFTKGDEEQENQAVPVTVQEVALGDIENISVYTGRIAASDEVQVVSKIPGKVESVHMEVGDYVEEGTPLVILETDELKAQLAQARAAAAAASANLEANKAGALPQQLEQVTAAKQQAEAAFLNAEADYSRMKALYEADAISEQAFDAMELKYKVAKSQYETAKEQVRLTEQRLPSNIKTLEAQLEQAEAAVQLLETNLRNSVIRAPISGILANKLIEPGEVAAAGYPLAVVVNIDEIEIVVHVSDNSVNCIDKGQEVDLYVAALGKEHEIKGVVSTISPVSDQSRLFQVKIKVENSEHKLKPGMFAEVRLNLGTKENVLVVPKDCIAIKKHGNTVFVVEEGKATERMVRVGVSQGDLVEITDGILGGELVVVSGHHMLTDGTAIKYEE